MEASRGDHEPRSWTLRVLAPLALLATAAVLIAIVAGSLSDSGSDGKSSSSSTSTTSGKGCASGNPPADAALEAGYYIIKAGETFGTVTERTCIQGSRLEQLNPELDPLQLQVGACVNLKPDGCKNAGSG
jgi:hypothetical protein